MKTLPKILLALLIASVVSTCAFCQDVTGAKALINRGIALNDSGKYDEAIAKYREALKLDPENLQAQYEMSYTLSNSGHPDDAIPILEKLIPTNRYAEAYNLIANIYDDKKDFEKSTAYYQQGIIAFPDNQRLRFNLGISFLRQKMYPEAEQAAIKAIQLDPKHASSHRLYALATYGEDKRGVSLLAWCSFLLLEPQTARSAEGFRYVEKLLNYGIKNNSEKSVTINVSTGGMEGPNFMMPMTVLAATLDKKGLTRADSLALQLKSVFEISENFDGKKGNPFYKSSFSDYFKGLAATENMPAFARFISISVYKDENLQWFKDNAGKLSALDSWVAATKRDF